MLWSPISLPSPTNEPLAASDREWFVPLTFIVLIETLLWCAAYLAGHVARPMLVTYGTLTIGFFVLTLAWKGAAMLVRERPASPTRLLVRVAVESRERLAIAIFGSLLLGLGAAAFGSLKAGIPHLIPFWFDQWGSRFEDWLFGVHPALIIDPRIPLLLPVLDRFYATFVPMMMIAILVLLASKPSREKSRAIVALALAWLVVGVIAAYLCSSAGPIFYDRVYGGQKFALLTALLHREAPLTTLAADMLWASHVSGIPTFGDGISAFPSMHVTMTMWLALFLSRTRFAPLGWTYLTLIWIGSVLLGWHWGIDGIGGGLLMLCIWKIAPRFLHVERTSAEAALIPVPAPAGAEALTEELAG